MTPFDFYDYPISHSLLAGFAWAALFGLLYLRFTWYRRGALVGAGLVLSHWVLDFASHRPDVPVFPSGPYVGFGLWNSVPLTLLVEGGIFGAGVVLYLRQTYPLDGVGRYAFGGLVVFLLSASNSGPILGPPPPSMKAVAIMTLAVVPLIVGWAALVERHRDLSPTATRPGSSPRRSLK